MNTIFSRRKLLVAVAALTATVAAGSSVGAKGAQGPNGNGRTVDIQILQYSDWHGSISTAPQFAALVKAEEAANPNTLLLTGGDDFGGTEPVSSLNDDIPAILVQNALGTDAAGLGNHNFDGGISNLQAKIDLAEYPYISSNLANVDDNVSGVAPYVIFEFAPQIKVAVIGFTNEEAPTLVFPGNFGSIEITDAATAVMAAKRQAARAGADVFIAIGHKGVRSFDAAGNPRGELIDFARQLTGFAAVLGDHTDVEYTGVINGAIVSETESHGHGYNKLTFTVKPGSGKIVSSSVTAVEIDPAGPADPDMQALIQPFFDSLAAKFDVKIAVSTGRWNRSSSNYERLGESELGNLFADSMLAASPNADVAFTNSGGVRSTLSPSNYVASDPTLDRNLSYPDDVVIGDLFSVHNFGNATTTQTVTGEQLHDAMEHAVGALPGADRFPQIAGFQLVFDSSLTSGGRVGSMTLDDGTLIPDDPAFTLVLATTNFISAGGDGYTMLADPTRESGLLLTTVLQQFVQAAGTISPAFDCRVVDQNPAGAAASRPINPLGTLANRADCA